MDARVRTSELSASARIVPAYRPPPADELRTVFADDHLIIANKPSGLLSVPGIGPDKAICAQSILAARFGEALTVHRLDMDTSGLMVFARSKSAQRDLSKQFQERTVKKTYEAVVSGHPSQPSGRIDLPIAKYSRQRPLRHIDLEGQEAITKWQVISCSKTATRILLRPLTGRSHQIRLHMKSIGHPILGDAFYGDENRTRRLLLHAKMLSIQGIAKPDPLSFDIGPDF